MKTSILTTIKGGFDTSLCIILNTMHKVGDILDLSTIIHLVPEGMSYNDFFKEYVNFCVENDSSKFYRIDSIMETQQGYEMQVSPITVRS